MKPSSASIRRHVTRTLFVLALFFAVGGWWFISTKNVPPSSRQPAQQAEKPPGVFAAEPSWLQDFTRAPDGPVDATIWNPATPELPIYNDEEQVYTPRPQNLRVKDGLLVIEARKEQLAGKAYTSGRLDTKGRQQFLYGKIEAVMKFPEGKGTWPAFWMLSASGKYTAALKPAEADWAQPRFYMHDGELDIVEFVGSNPGRIESSAHTFAKSHTRDTRIPGNAKGFHAYAIEWTPQTVAFTVDGKAYHRLQKSSDNPNVWPFDQPMYLILNLAMGGRMGGEIDARNRSSWQLQVKQVAYYHYIGK